MAVLDLLDYRRRVSEMYRRVRTNPDPRVAWERWTADRQALFATHPQSAWDEAGRHARRLRYFPYDPAWRLEAEVEPLNTSSGDLGHSAEGATPAAAMGTVTLALDTPARLLLHWLSGYSGGLFLAFRDATNGSTTYGGGRYLLDTAKGADLGGSGETLVLDFNFAYHPSCAHSNRWSCPLPPAENRLATMVEAGERLP